MAYNTSNQWKTKVEGDDKSYVSYLLLNNTYVPMEQISQIDFIEDVIDSESENMYLGTFRSNQIDITFKNLNNLNIESNLPVYLEIGLDTNYKAIECEYKYEQDGLKYFEVINHDDNSYIDLNHYINISVNGIMYNRFLVKSNIFPGDETIYFGIDLYQHSDIKTSDEIIAYPYEYVPQGHYLIEEPDENYYNTCKITCLDHAVKLKTNCDYSSLLENIYTQTDDVTYKQGEIYYKLENDEYIKLIVDKDYQVNQEITGVIYKVTGKTPISVETLLIWICQQYNLKLGTYPEINNDVLISVYDSTLSGKTYISYIAELMGGNAKINKLNELCIFPLKKNIKNTLPAGYNQVEYIESNGYQYIDTGISVTPTTKIDLNCEVLYCKVNNDTANPNQIERQDYNLLGSYINGLALSVYYNKFRFWNSSSTAIYNYETNKKYHIVLNDNGRYTINDEEIQLAAYDVPQNNNSIYLFSAQYSKKATKSGAMKLYDCKIFDNEELVRDFVPCYSTIENKLGLYDLVSNVFFSNNGTNNFKSDFIKPINALKRETFKVNEKYTISKVYYTDGSRVYEKGTDEYNTLRIRQENMFIVDENVINNIYESVKDFTIYSLETKAPADLSLDSWDIINFQTDYDEETQTYLTYPTINNHKTTYAMSIVGTISTKIPSKQKENTTNIVKATDGENIRRIQSEINQLDGTYKVLAQDITNTKSEINDNYYSKGTIDEMIINAKDGIVNTFTTVGGDNVFKNTGLWFKYEENENNISQNKYWEYWIGNANKIDEIKSTNGMAIVLKNESFEQSQKVNVGNYTISFVYKKLVPLANVTMNINNKSYELNEEEFTAFTETSYFDSGQITIKFNSDVENSCEIYDLMVNVGETSLPYNQNQNEITNTTVQISEGITINNDKEDTIFKADNDGIRIKDKNTNNNITYFTKVGMETKQAKITQQSEIVGLLFQRVDGQTWVSWLGDE